jgi:hypothetical protein
LADTWVACCVASRKYSAARAKSRAASNSIASSDAIAERCLP